MAKKFSRLRRVLDGARALSDERALQARSETSKLHRFVHFWVLVGRSFNRNRCPVRASALAYATLLSLIPMLAVVVSITSTFLKKEGEDRIDQFIVKMVASVTPPAPAGTNSLPGATNTVLEPADALSSGNSFIPSDNTTAARTNEAAVSAGGQTPDRAALSPLMEDQKAVAARKAIARNIHQFIQTTRSGALGVTGSVVLIFAAISLLSRIEDAFNDIWGVVRGRSWFMRIVLYWGVLTLAPLLLVVALGLATGAHLETFRLLVQRMPYVGRFLFEFGFYLLPVVISCLTFALFYMLMPNARVRWQAALVGGLVGGLLFHLNNLVSVLYVSRVVVNSMVYGSLGLVPVFMIGLYFCWLILLFGAQVAYAFQNRTAYLEEKQIENVNQRGREFIALRLMTSIGLHFCRGEPPLSVTDMSEELSVPTRLIRQVMQPLLAARLVVETAESAFLPARPLERITCHDILQALRASQGQELETRDEPVRAEVYGEFQRILEAERQAASSVTMLALVNRAAARRQITA
jgi:membrane protein